MADPSYVVYVDESGDEGFVFRPGERGSSRWLVLSAAVFRRKNDHCCVDVLKETRSIIDKPAKRALHFRDLRHQHRIPYLRRIAAVPVRTVTVLIYKPALDSPESYQADPHLLYRYASRLLLERVSWLCRDQRLEGEGDGTAQLIFSNRSAMSYDDLRSYLELLRNNPTQFNCSVHWPAIDPSNVRAVNHDQLAGLQIADAVASSMFCAVNLNPFGEAEPRYVEILAPTVYRERKVWMGYGLKFWPAWAMQKKTLEHLSAFERFV